MVESQDSQNTVFPDKLPLNVAPVEFHLVLGFGCLSNLAVTANEGTVCEALDTQDVQIKQKLIQEKNSTSVLFDTENFCKQLEAVYLSLWKQTISS